MAVLGFEDMPAEVRLQIYEHLFKGAVIEDYGLSPQPIRTKNYHLPITMTNHQIRAESLSVLRAETTFHFRIGQAGATPVPEHVLCEIKTVRLPLLRLETLDTSSFASLTTLVLDISIDASIWRIYQVSRAKSEGNLADVSDMVHLGMTMGVFEHSWTLDQIWRDQSRKFRILCWFNTLTQGKQEGQPTLIDIDSGMILEEPK